MRLPLATIVSFILDHPFLTFTDVSRRLRIPYAKVKKAAEQESISVKDSHAMRREAIVSFIRANPGVPYHRLGERLGLKYPTLSAIASQAGIYRHVPRKPAVKEEREKKVLHSLKEGKTFIEAAKENRCSKHVVCRVAKDNAIRRPGCPPFSYTKEEEGRVLAWLSRPTPSYPVIAKETGVREHTVFHIAVRNGIRRRLPTFYRGEIAHGA
jgi:hypothetical protein